MLLFKSMKLSKKYFMHRITRHSMFIYLEQSGEEKKTQRKSNLSHYLKQNLF